MDIEKAAGVVDKYLLEKQAEVAAWRARCARLRKLTAGFVLDQETADRLKEKAEPTRPLVVGIEAMPEVGQGWAEPYSVVAVDGSETLLSHHDAYTLPFISVATVELGFGQESRVTHQYAVPELKDGADDSLRRSSATLELQAAVKGTHHFQTPNSDIAQNLLLMDGSLIPWGLLRLGEPERSSALKDWRALIKPLLNVPMFGYISQSASREVVRTLAVIHSLSELETDGVLDRHIVAAEPLSAQFRLAFGNGVELPVVNFAFVLADEEVVRIEWLGEAPGWLPDALVVLLNQIEAGKGYPPALSEAHEQATIRGTDRALLRAVEERALGRVLGGSAKGFRKRMRGIA